MPIHCKEDFITQDERNIAEWKDDKNWRGGWLGLYQSPNDTRVWVPKRNPTYGWTVNFAHRAGWLWMFVLVGFPMLIIILAACIMSIAEL